MRFRDVIGHGEVVQRLVAASRRGTAHAYLLHGPDGVGKRARPVTTFASRPLASGQVKHPPPRDRG